MTEQNWLSRQWDWVKGFLSEESGKASSKRLASLAVVCVFLVAYMRVAIALIKDGQPEIRDIPEGWAWMIGGIIGLGVFDKIASKFKNEPPKVT